MPEPSIKKVKLGKTDLVASQLGIGAVHGAPAIALEEAFEAGCNYFYWGALRNSKMATAIRNIVAKGKRDELIVVIQAFRRNPQRIERSLLRGLKKLGLDYADILLLGWYNKPPKLRSLKAVEDLQNRETFRFLGLSGHNRKLFAEISKDLRFDLFHIRYNAANRGAEKDIFPHLPEERPGIVSFTATKRMSLVRSRKIPFFEKRPTAGDCYRFVLSHPSVDIVITDPSNASQLRENLTEVSKGPMTDKEMEWMKRIGDYVYRKKRIF